MERRFEGFEYDLSQNLVFYKNEELVSLYNHSLILSITHIYRNPEILKKIKNVVDFIEDLENLSDINVTKMKTIEYKIKIKYLDYCKSKNFSKDNLLFYKEQIRYLLVQIIYFVKSKKYTFNQTYKYLSNITFTSQGTVNLKKTVYRILKNPSETRPISKFEVASRNFIDEITIKRLYDSLKYSNYERRYICCSPNFKTYYDLCYWKWKFQGTDVKLLKHSGGHEYSYVRGYFENFSKDEAILKIFRRAVEDNNELAVQYLWTNHISKMQTREESLINGLKLTYSDATKINIFLYLLFQIKSDELKGLIICMSLQLLKNIIKNIRWHCYFINIYENLKKYLSSQSIARLLHILIKSHCQDYPNGINYSTLIKYSSSMSQDAKDCLLENDTKLMSTLTIVIEDRDDLVNLLLNVGNSKKLKSFFLSKLGASFHNEAKENKKLELVDNILKKNFEESDIQEIKLFWKKAVNPNHIES